MAKRSRVRGHHLTTAGCRQGRQLSTPANIDTSRIFASALAPGAPDKSPKQYAAGSSKNSSLASSDDRNQVLHAFDRRLAVGPCDIRYATMDVDHQTIGALRAEQVVHPVYARAHADVRLCWCENSLQCCKHSFLHVMSRCREANNGASQAAALPEAGRFHSDDALREARSGVPAVLSRCNKHAAFGRRSPAAAIAQGAVVLRLRIIRW